MKRLSLPLIALCVAILSGCASMTPAPPSMLSYQKAYDTKLSAKKVFDKSKDWLAMTFVDSSEVIESANEETRKIIGNGTVSIWNSGITVIPVRFSIVIEAKESRYRVTFDNYVAYWGQSRNQPAPVKYKSIAERTTAKVKKLAADLNAYLEDGSTDDNW